MSRIEPRAVSWSGLPTSELASIDITTQEFKVEAFDFWARLRVDAPVQPVRWARHGTAWVITRYSDVEIALRDPRLCKNRRDALTPEQLAAGPTLPKALASLERVCSASTGRIMIVYVGWCTRRSLLGGSSRCASRPSRSRKACSTRLRGEGRWI